MSLIFLFFTLVTTSNAAMTCQDLFAHETFGQIKSTFEHTKHYDVEIPQTSEIKDQCRLHHCHLYAWTSHLEQSGSIPLSSEYLDYRYLFKKALEALEQNVTDLELFLGSPPITSRIMMQSMGLMPQGIWQPKKPLSREPTYSKVVLSLETIILQAQWEKSTLIDIEAQVELIKSARRQIYALMDNIIGAPPENFFYKGEAFTPVTFAQRYYPNLFAPVVFASLRTSEEQANNFSGVQTRTLYLELPQLENLVRKVIDSGQAVYLTYSHHRQFVSDINGVISTTAFNYPSLMLPLDRAQRKQFDKYKGHAVLIVGYERDSFAGRIRKWKIKNSWSKDKGDEGYFHMYNDYFEIFMENISFVDEGRVALPYK